MSISVICACGRQLRARDEFAGTRAECPTCGELVAIPAASKPMESHESAPDSGSPPEPQPRARERAFAPEAPPIDLVEFLDPPRTRPPVAETTPETPVLKRMFEALLDPRAIHWMLTIGGGLAVLGLVVWLVSLRIFEDPRVMAVALGTASLSLLGGGWWTTLKTRFHVAGQALTFLACVVLPLNLWFYDAQNLIVVDQHLWVGALLCVALYGATVYVLRNPLFLYACEAGITLTTLLLLGDLGMLHDAGNVALALVAMAVASIHLERAFQPVGEFDRRRYGLPLFWSGHAQLGAGLLTLLASQCVHWLSDAFGWGWSGNRLTDQHLLAGGLWIAATYLYLYSDLIVRRVGVYLYLAGVSLLMAEVTLVLPHVRPEGLIVALSLTALTLQLIRFWRAADDERLTRHAATISLILTVLPVLIGVALHLRATSELAARLGVGYATGWEFVGAMLLVAVTARVSAFLNRHDQPAESQASFFLSAAALLIAAAGLLRQVDWVEWFRQAPVLMLVPIGYMVAARLWRGRTPETPLARVGQASTAVILLGTALAAFSPESGAFLRPVVGRVENLYLGITFLEAMLFYVLGGLFRRRGWNAYLATLSGCGALWQFLGYSGVDGTYYPLVYAVLGIAGLVVARLLGLRSETRYDNSGEPREAIRGPGRTVLQCGNAVLSLALVVAFLQGLLQLGSPREWLDLAVLLATVAAGAIAVPLSPTADWRRWYITATCGLAAIAFLTLNLLIHLSGWQKLEMFCVALGLLQLIASHIGLFRESEQTSETVSIGLWLGSLLTVVPLFTAMLYHRFYAGAPSLIDELGLLTVTILMVVSGCGWQIRASTLLGGGGLVLYLMILVGSLAHRPEAAIGVYLLIGGGLIFAAGVVLSIYRDRLMELPEMIARREGIFRVIGWR